MKYTGRITFIIEAENPVEAAQRATMRVRMLKREDIQRIEITRVDEPQEKPAADGEEDAG